MGMFNKLFMGMDAIDGVKKVNTAFKDTDNKYHDILGNRIIKIPTQNGEMNAVNSGNTMYRAASEMIDELFEKEAGIKDVGKKIGNKITKIDEYFGKNLDDYLKFKKLYATSKNTEDKKKMIIAAKNLAKVGIPASGVALSAGVGLSKGLEKVEKKFGKNKDEKSYFPEVASATVVGAAAYDALSNKSLLSPVKNIGNASKDVFVGYPKRVIAGSGKVGRMVINIANMLKGNLNKKASEEIDDIFFSKTAGIDKEKVTKFVVKNFVQDGLSAIPYVAAPAVASYALGRDIRHGGAKIKNTYDDKIIIDIPNEILEKQQKTANYDPMPWNVFFKKELPAKAMQGLSRSVFPTAVVAVTGRNITNAMEKVNDNNKLDPVEPGKTRIIIQTSSPVENIRDKKASEILDELFKIAEDKPSSGAEKDAEKTIENIEKGKKKDPETLISIRLTQNQKRQQRMLR